MTKFHRKKIRRLLYLSLDGELPLKKRHILDEALQESEELRREKNFILAQRQTLRESGTFSFQSHFSERVMARISGIKQKNGMEVLYAPLKVFFRGLAIASTGLMIFLLIYILKSGEIFSMDEIYYASDTTAQEVLNLPLF
ncbi:MAG: hypothetical protein JXB26_06835 [Candidatus Aminicenantes bacterium]|nr:hypothetical protein [Candidatus Aminicenantes bacterium]